MSWLSDMKGVCATCLCSCQTHAAAGDFSFSLKVDIDGRVAKVCFAKLRDVYSTTTYTIHYTLAEYIYNNKNKPLFSVSPRAHILYKKVYIGRHIQYNNVAFRKEFSGKKHN